MQRTHNPEKGTVFVIMPFGKKVIGPDGVVFDFDLMYTDVLKPLIESLGMRCERIDEVFDTTGLSLSIWRSIQRAELLIVDFTGRAPNVSLEVGWAMAIKKRFVSITQFADDIPSDIRGMDRYLSYSSDAFQLRKFEKDLQAQIEALRQQPCEEMTLAPLFGSASERQIVGAVSHVDQDCATVRTGDGRFYTLSGADVDYARIYPDLRKRFKPGDQVNGSYLFDVSRSEMRFTLLGGQEDPWPTIAQKHPVGSIITDKVVSANDIGAFVHVFGKINGLIPRSGMFGVALAVGDTIEAEVTRVDAVDRKIGLGLKRVVGQLEDRNRPVVDQLLPKVGETFEGEITRTVPAQDGRGNYVLIRLPGHRRDALLPASNMKPDLRADFASGQLEVGDLIDVEVIEVQPERRKVVLADIGEADEPDSPPPESASSAA
jgi:small subunit ribosomal protein S1